VLLWGVGLSGLALTAALVYRSGVAGHWALTNMYESVLSLALGTQGLWVWFRGRYPGLQALGWPFLVAQVGLLGFALTLPVAIEPIQPALASYWRAIHVPIILLSYALFVLSGLSAVGELLKKTSPLDPSGGEGIPREGTRSLSELTYETTLLGFALLAIGIILGAVWANEAWGTYWNWDPKESMALATLLGYGIYLHFKVRDGLSGKALAWVNLGAFLLLVLTYVGVNLMGVGMHSYGAFGVSS
jgi:cytochrome c-type biogenesis protein CcsB